MSVLFDNATLTLRLGSAWDGQTTPTFSGTTASIMGRAQRFSFNDSVERTNVRGAGDANNKNRYHSRQGEINISQFVATTGFAYATAGSVTKIGFWIEVTHKPNSSMATATVYTGVITRWETNGSRGDATVEEIVIDLNPDNDPIA